MPGFSLIQSVLDEGNRQLWSLLGISLVMPLLFLYLGISAVTFIAVSLLPLLLGAHFYCRATTVHDLDLDSREVRRYPFDLSLLAGLASCWVAGALIFLEIYQSGLSGGWFAPLFLSFLWSVVALWIAITVAIHLITPEDLGFE